MIRCYLLVIIFCIVASSFEHGQYRSEGFEESTTSEINTQGSDSALNNSSVKAEDQLTMQIYEIIEHFKQQDPIGLPLIPLPDPADIPDINQTVSTAKLQMFKPKLYGVSKFRIQNFDFEIKEMKAKCGILFESLIMKGDYQLTAFMMKSRGPFSIILRNVLVEGNASIGVERDGKLRSQEINIDISFSDMKMEFKNLGLFASIFQSIANSASNVIFDSAKPFLLKDAYAKIRTAIDTNLDALVGDAAQIPNSISPIDNAIAYARKQVQIKGYDPFQVAEYNYPGVFGGKIFNTWLYGISSFYRLGDMALNIKDNKINIILEIGTQEISGTTMWQVSIAKGMITRAGHLQFTVQHIKVKFQITQPLNLSKKLMIDELQLDLGNIQIRSSGLGTADYLVEFFVNITPNLLRYQIMDALEKPVMRKIQEFTDKIDVEKLVKDKLVEYQKTGTVKIDLNVEL